VIVPSVRITPGPPVGAVPVATVSAGHVVRQPPVQLLFPLSFTSFLNTYTVFPFAPATRTVPILPTDFASTVACEAETEAKGELDTSGETDAATEPDAAGGGYAAVEAEAELPVVADEPPAEQAASAAAATSTVVNVRVLECRVHPLKNMPIVGGPPSVAIESLLDYLYLRGKYLAREIVA
jgi:hypothetical protein